MKKNIFILNLIIFAIIRIYSENTVYEFGPKTEQAVVFTASRDVNNNETISTNILNELAKQLAGIKLRSSVIIAVTDNDIPDLPETLSITEHKNTKQLINKIYEKKTAAVFILSDGSGDSVKIISGSGKKTSPSWMLEDLFAEFKKENIKINFNSNNIILRRLGFLEENKILSEYLNEGIAAVEISTNMDITSALLALTNIYSQNIPQDWDKHYIIKNIFGFKIIKERILIIMMIAIILSSLFYIFMFGFLFGNKKELYIKDLLKLWRVPFLFFLLHTASFYASEYIVLFIFRLFLGSSDAIDLFPLLATAFKFILGFTISSGFLIANKKTNLPQNGFIYGYLTSLVCFLNIFIFSSFDLSLSLMFLEIYVLSFISYHLKKPYLQIMFFILNIWLAIYYFYQILFHTDNVIPVLFYSNNFMAAVFVTPYYLAITQIFFNLKKHNPKTKFTKVSAHIFMNVVSVICFLFVIIHPDFLRKEINKVFLIYKISGKNKSVEVVSNLKTLPANNADKNYLKQFDSLNINDFIDVDYKLENYLERSIGEIKVTPAMNAAVIAVLIMRENGFPIYEANAKFKTSPSGYDANFLSPLNIAEPYSIKFSGEKNTTLNVKVDAFFYDNSLKTLFNSAEEKKKLIFQITKEFVLTADSEK